MRRKKGLYNMTTEFSFWVEPWKEICHNYTEITEYQTTNGTILFGLKEGNTNTVWDRIHLIHQKLICWCFEGAGDLKRQCT